MKATLLFSAAILLSAVSFAQTAASNHDAVKSATSAQGDKNSAQLKSTTSAASSTSVQTKAVSKTAAKTRATAAKTEKAAVTEKNELAATGTSATAHVIKPKPASVRMKTSIKAGAGIRIK